MFDALFYGLMWKSSEHMTREDAVIIGKYNFYEQYKAKQVKKMNLETSESYDSTDISTTFIEDELTLQ